MKRHLLIAGLLLMTVAGAGCIVIDVEEGYSCEPAAVESRETTVQEIDAIGRLGIAGHRSGIVSSELRVGIR